jgi:hypothetical protein
MKNELKILTFYSDSHYKMFNDFFISSYDKYLSKYEIGRAHV